MACRGGLVLLFAVSLALLAGCSRPPLDQRISAATEIDYNIWLGDVGRSASPQLMADIQQASQEIQLALMRNGPVGSGSAVSADFLARVNGLTLRQFLLMGFADQATRLETEQHELTVALARQTSLRTNPGDTASANYLAELIRSHRERLAEVSRELAAVRAKLAAYAPPAPPKAN